MTDPTHKAGEQSALDYVLSFHAEHGDSDEDAEAASAELELLRKKAVRFETMEEALRKYGDHAPGNHRDVPPCAPHAWDRDGGFWYRTNEPCDCGYEAALSGGAG